VTSGVVIRGAPFPYNTERIAEVEKRQIESKKSGPLNDITSFQEGQKGALVLLPGASVCRTSALWLRPAEFSGDLYIQIVSELRVDIA
jgi:hypothetical protein